MMMKLRWLFVALFCCVACLAAPVYPGDLDKKQVLADAVQVTVEKYPDADYVQLDSKEYVVYQPDGTYVTYYDEAVKILTDRGVREYQTYTRYFSARYSKAAFLRAEIYSPFEKPRAIDLKKNVRVTVDNSQMGNNIYDEQDKLLCLTLPGVSVGDVIRITYKEECFKSRMANQYCNYLVCEGNHPILKNTVIIDAPKSKPLAKIATFSPVKDTLKFTKQEKGDRIQYTWIARNVPQAFPEPKMPAWYTCVQRVIVSTCSSWEEVSRWYWGLCKPHLQRNEEMDRKVQELIRGCRTEQQKVRAIFRFVSQQIRYMGETTETEAPGYEPHDAIQTFTKRHGVCRDKASLLVALLRSAGLEAFPVLIQVGPPKDPEVPYFYFNHAITAVKLNGAYQLMDSTDEQTADLFPSYLSNCSYLVAHPQGETLRLSPVTPAAENELVIHTRSQLDKNGDLTGSVELHFKGINDNIYRGGYSEMQEEDRRKHLEKCLQSVIPGGQLLDWEVEPANILDISKPLKIHLSYQKKGYVSPKAKTAVFSVPTFGWPFSFLTKLLGNMSLQTRRFPFKCITTCAVREKAELQFEQFPGVPQNLPANLDIQEPGIVWKRHCSCKNKHLVVESYRAVEKVLYSATEYGVLRNTLKAAAETALQQVILKPEAQVLSYEEQEKKADSILLSIKESVVLKTPVDYTRTSTLRRKILTYQGKKENSELRFFHHPEFEKVTLKYAKVFVKGREYPLNLEELKMIPDEAWGTAPRYSRGVYLVANLPAVEEGAEIEYQVVREVKNGTPFRRLFFLQKDEPAREQLYAVTVPSGLDLQKALHEGGILMEKDFMGIHENTLKMGDTVTYTWSCSNMPPLARDASIPPLRTVAPYIALSCGEWREYAEKIYAAMEEKAKFSPEGLKYAASLLGYLRKMKDPREQAMALRSFLNQGVRSIASPRFTALPMKMAFTSAEQVLQEGYGHWADCAILSYAILSVLGYEPEFLLVSENRYPKKMWEPLLEEDFDPSSFSDVIVRCKMGKHTFWFNDSNQYGEPRCCTCEGKPYLNRRGRISSVQVDGPYRDFDESITDVTLRKDGSALVHYRNVVRGVEYARLNRLFSEQTPEEHRRYVQSVVSGISLGAHLVGKYTTEFDSYPGIVDFTVEVPDFAVVQGQYLLLNVYEQITGLLKNGGEKRILPFYCSSAPRGSGKVTVHLPEEFPRVVQMPDSREVKAGGKRLGLMKFYMRDDCFIYKYEYEWDPFCLSLEDYAEYLQMLHALRQNGFPRLILGRVLPEE